jgi:hypothetical protein
MDRENYATDLQQSWWMYKFRVGRVTSEYRGLSDSIVEFGKVQVLIFGTKEHYVE